MDDATSTISSAFLVEEEGTSSTFQALLEVFVAHGLPLSLYTDRGSHYFSPRRPERPWTNGSPLRSAGRSNAWESRADSGESAHAFAEVGPHPHNGQAGRLSAAFLLSRSSLAG
jgi:hypothetical protein